MRARTFAALLIAGVALMITVPAQAQQDETKYSRWLGTRYDIWLAVPSWPGLQDLEPDAGGSFHAVGYGIGGSAHWPIRRFEHTELLAGFDIEFTATDSSVPSSIGDVFARRMMIGASCKWVLGEKRNKSLDFGAAYYEVDIAEMNANYWLEYEDWTESAFGGFVGATWDVGAGREGKTDGLSLGLKVHFVDLGMVSEAPGAYPPPVLGSNAGTLEGPIYSFQVGYSGR